MTGHERELYDAAEEWHVAALARNEHINAIAAGGGPDALEVDRAASRLHRAYARLRVAAINYARQADETSRLEARDARCLDLRVKEALIHGG